MVQVVMSFLDDTPDLPTKLAVIETLRTVTDGKVGGVSRVRADGQTMALTSRTRSSSRSNERE